MKDALDAVQRISSFDFSDEQPTMSGSVAIEWPAGSRPIPTLPAADEEVGEMQVRLYADNLWHRRALVPAGQIPMTACQKDADPRVHAYSAIRMTSLKGPLCKVCHTPFELELSGDITQD